MYFKIIDNDGKDLKILITNLDCCFVNSIRRVIMSEIGGYAFDEIEIKKNTTIFHNEFIKHRIGLIPILMGNEITFECSVKNEKEVDRYVLSDEIRCIEDNMEYKIMDDIPLIVLSKNDEINFIAKSRKGLAKEDIKYSLIENIKFVKVKKILGDIPEKLVKYMYKDLYYGRKYLLNDVKYKETNDYCIMMTSIYEDVLKVLRIGLMALRRKLVEMRDKEVEMIVEKDNFYNFRIEEIDYGEASILTNMLMKREEIKLATYTKKHFLDNFYEFKIETFNERISVLQLKEIEMDKSIKIVDKIIKEI